MSVLPYDDWMKQTNTGFTSVRSNEVRDIDTALLAYHRATTPYGREWQTNELRIALEKWKTKQGPNWKSSERNKNKSFERLDTALPALKRRGNGYHTELEGESAENLRQAVLFFLMKSSTSPIPTDIASFLNDGTDTSSDLHAFVGTGETGGWRAAQGKFYDKDNKQNGFLADLSEKLIDYIKSLAESVGVDEFSTAAANWIVQQLPELLLKVFAGTLSKVTTVNEIRKGLQSAGKAAIATWKTRHCAEGIMSGHPRIVVESVRQQIKNSGYDGVKSAVKVAFLAGLTFVPAAGEILSTIANAVASVWAFVTKVFDHFREMKKLKKIFLNAADLYSAEFYRRPKRFNRWFKDTIKICRSFPLTASRCHGPAAITVS
jgi:hypothetical protein